MSGLLGTIGNFFSSSAGKGLGEIAGLGATGAGLVGNLAADRQRSQAAKLAQANANLTPQQLATMVNGATLPLNKELVQAITGNVNANMAEQGLSEAPGLQAAAIAQGLAIPEQQQQQNALQLVLRKLGLPAEFASTIPPNTNLAPLLALLMKGFGTPGSPAAGKSITGGAAGSFPTMPYPINASGAMPFPIVPPTGPAWNPSSVPPYNPGAPPELDVFGQDATGTGSNPFDIGQP